RSAAQVRRQAQRPGHRPSGQGVPLDPVACGRNRRAPIHPTGARAQHARAGNPGACEVSSETTYIVLGGGVVLAILVIAWLARVRRREKALMDILDLP